MTSVNASSQAVSSYPQVVPGAILEGELWPERVRVLSVERIGDCLRIQVVGVDSGTYRDVILSPEQLTCVSAVPVSRRTFTGNGEAFFLGLEAHRVEAAHRFDPLLAVSVCQVDPLPHQIDAVYYHILRRPRIRFLLADDPGAGKTIMAGLLLKELKYRGLVHRTLVVVPGHLRDQWRREMKERFGEHFELVDRDRMRASWGRNVWQEIPQILTSMEFAKQGDVLAAIRDSTWDLIIVDEAHKMAAYRYGEKTSKTERYKLGEVLSRSSRFFLLLTATPHRGDPENFRLFLDLLEPGMFADAHMLEQSLTRGENPLSRAG
ncbi:MAG: DEAD/DEAH box helicase [Thermoguttaceae bacterium]|nr:DEAD/DEAH box helicase [Thermoguttaceae bacterium]MDW8079505.1 DEAD/DEAH box helicase [Thermoguttaceae bacterium]